MTRFFQHLERDQVTKRSPGARDKLRTLQAVCVLATHSRPRVPLWKKAHAVDFLSGHDKQRLLASRFRAGALQMLTLAGHPTAAQPRLLSLPLMLNNPKSKVPPRAKGRHDRICPVGVRGRSATRRTTLASHTTDHSSTLPQ